MRIKKILVVVVTEDDTFLTETHEDDLLVEELNSILSDQADPALFLTAAARRGFRQPEKEIK